MAEGECKPLAAPSDGGLAAPRVGEHPDIAAGIDRSDALRGGRVGTAGEIALLLLLVALGLRRLQESDPIVVRGPRVGLQDRNSNCRQRKVRLLVREYYEAHVELRDHRDLGHHARQPTVVRNALVAIEIVEPPAEAVGREMGVGELEQLATRVQRRLCRPHLLALGFAEEHRAARGLAAGELRREPLGHAGDVALDAAGGSDDRNLEARDRTELALDDRVGRGEVRRVLKLVQCDRAGVHTERREHAGRHEVFPAHAGDRRDDFAGHHVHQVVVGELRSKAGRGLQEPERANDVMASEIGRRHEHEIAGAEAEPAAVGQEVADREFAGHVRVRHPKVRQVVDHLVVPVELARIDEDRDRGGRERLRVRADRELRIRIDHRGLAELAHAVALRKDELAILDDANGDAGHQEGSHRPVDETVDFGRAQGPARSRRRGGAAGDNGEKREYSEDPWGEVHEAYLVSRKRRNKPAVVRSANARSNGPRGGAVRGGRLTIRPPGRGTGRARARRDRSRGRHRR